jgi:hypothetical protein
MRLVKWLDRMLSEDQFKVFFMILCLFAGIPLALGAPAPSSVVAALPVLVIRLWGVTLALGGVTSLVGIAMRHATRSRLFIEGLIIEGAGLVALASAAATFATVIIVVNATWSAAFGTATYFMFVAACIFRFRTIRRVVRKMQEAIELERRLQSGD